MTFLHISAVRKSYGSVQALSGVSLAVEKGSHTAIVGPSGSGKTTLLRILAGFEAPDAGQLVLDGELLADATTLVPAHRRGIGYVPQEGALFPHLSIADNVGFGLPRHDAQRNHRIEELMDMVALDRAMLKRRPHELSGGQQQRVALARALAQSPKLMLMDEPFSALDTGLRAATRKAVAQLLDKAGITTILVTHDQGEALSFADQVAIMRNGQLVQTGAPRDLYLRPTDPLTAEFLGEALVMQAPVSQGWCQCPLGRIAVDDAQRSGMATLMLRPEQLHLEVIDDSNPTPELDAQACLGVVQEVDFFGPTCDLLVSLNDYPQDKPIHIHSAGLQAPAAGAKVRVRVQGLAHVFPPLAL